VNAQVTTPGGLDARMRTGGILAIIGGLLCTVVNLLIFLYSYPIVQERYIAKGMVDELEIVPSIFPTMTGIGVLAGILFFVAAYGFFAQKTWGWPLAVIAATGGLLAGWMCFLFPLMAGEAPLFLSIFLPNLAIWLVLVLHVHQVERKFWVLGLLAGMAFVMNFMNGIEVIKMLVNEQAPILLVVQELNWVAAIGWGLCSLALVFKRSWGVPVGIGAGILALVAGTPLAFVSATIDPLFLFGPIISLGLLIYFLVYGQKVADKADGSWTKSYPA